MSVAAILERLAENAGRRPRAGALIGQTIAQAAQVPGQILADREQQRQLQLQEARQAEQLGFARNVDARATKDQAAQDAAVQFETQKRAAMKLGVAAGFGGSDDPTKFDVAKASKAVTAAGFPELATTLAEFHDKMLPKLTSGAPGSVMRGPDGKVIEGSAIPIVKPDYTINDQRFEGGTAKPIGAAVAPAATHSTIYKEWEDHKAQGGTLSFDAYQTEDANRKRPVVRVNTGDARKDRRIDSRTRAFEALPLVKRTVTMAEAVGFADAMDVHTKNPADDQALIYAFAKAMDPDSVVREGEYATVQKYAQSWAQSFGFNAARVFSNTTFLTADARKNMKTTIATKFATAKKQYDGARSSFEKQINQITGEQNGAEYLTDFGSAFPPPRQAGPPAPTRIVYDMNGKPVK